MMKERNARLIRPPGGDNLDQPVRQSRRIEYAAVEENGVGTRRGRIERLR
jgi:hypothetical protein